MLFDAFTFGVSTFCVWISIGILMKKHRFRHRFCCFYLRRAVFSYQKQRQLHVRIWGSQIEVPKILKIEQNDQNERKFLFYFSSLRGRGKSSAMISEVKLTHFLSLFFFRNLKMRFRHASCRNFRKKSYPRIQTKINRIKKWSFLKILKNKCRVAGAAKVFFELNFGGDLAGWHARSAFFSFSY